MSGASEKIDEIVERVRLEDVTCVIRIIVREGHRDIVSGMVAGRIVDEVPFAFSDPDPNGGEFLVEKCLRDSFCGKLLELLASIPDHVYPTVVSSYLADMEEDWLVFLHVLLLDELLPLPNGPDSIMAVWRCLFLTPKFLLEQ